LGRQLLTFYVRRGRRILPALLLVLIITTAAAFVLFLPADLVRFGRYLTMTSALLGNIAAWTDDGYFTLETRHTPLLHLWSIAVEEQFYLAYPLLVLLISRWLPQHLLRILAAIAALSLAMCIWASYEKPSANFYLAPTRAWELLLGALLALGAAPRVGSRIGNEVLAAASLATLAVSVYWYDPTMRYPGLYAIPPCLAAAALIAVGRQQSTVTSRLLSLRPLIFTGLISYSLYLWHVPILTLFEYYHITKPGALEVGAVIASIYLISIASWMVIEKPIRRKVILSSDKPFGVAALGATIGLVAAGALLWSSDGLPGRFSPAARLVIEGGSLHGDASKCMTLSLSTIEHGGLCRYGPSDAGLPKVVVWGDSHALALLPAYEALANTLHLQLYFTATSSCRPLLGVVSRDVDLGSEIRCANFNAAMIEAIRRLAPRMVMLNAYWTHPNADFIPRSDLTVPEGESNFSRGLQETLKRIGASARAVCVVLDPPVMKYPVPYALSMANRRRIDPGFIAVSRADMADDYLGVERDVRALQQRGLLKTVDPKDVLCRAGACEFQLDGKPLYRDNNHLSVTGANEVASTLEPCLKMPP
jgi:peptidoglycan/LPS O-acetylase OafA/YrhL